MSSWKEADGADDASSARTLPQCEDCHRKEEKLVHVNCERYAKKKQEVESKIVNRFTLEQNQPKGLKASRIRPP